MNTYLFIFDQETGKRVTSFVIGVHGSTIDDLKKKAAADYPGYTVLEGTYQDLQQFLEGKVYKDGEITDYVPTGEETAAAARAAMDAECADAKAELVAVMQTAMLRGDMDAQQSIMQEFSDLQMAYAAAIVG